MAAVREILEFKEKVWLGDTIMCGQIADGILNKKKKIIAKNTFPGTRFYYQLIDDVLYLRFQWVYNKTSLKKLYFQTVRNLH